MPARLDLTGHVYGTLTVLAAEGKTKHGNICWRVRCVCGTELIVPGNNLRIGNSTNCGCGRAYWTRERITRRMQAWNEEYGRPPTGTEWREAGPDHPTAQTVYDVFGANGWNIALQAAGLRRRREGELCHAGLHELNGASICRICAREGRKRQTGVCRCCERTRLLPGWGLCSGCGGWLQTRMNNLGIDADDEEAIEQLLKYRNAAADMHTVTHALDGKVMPTLPRYKLAVPQQRYSDPND